MISWESSTFIARPAEEVFAYVADVRNDQHWHKDVKSATADNVIVTQDVAKDAALTAIVDRYRQASAPIANQIVGSITSSSPKGRQAT